MAPDFFIAGAPKSGTTALYHLLRSHPRLYLPGLKEPHYYAHDLGDYRAIRTRAEYAALFPSSCGETTGEASVFYLYSQEAVQRILADNADARFIVMLRRPVDLAASLHAHLLWRHHEDQYRFEDAWQMQPERRRGKKIPAKCRHAFRLQYGQIAMLGVQVERLLRRCDRRQIHLVFFEDFVHDQRRVVQSVLSFLGVDSPPAFPFSRANSSFERRLPRLDHFLSAPPGGVRVFKRWTERKLSIDLSALSRGVRNWNNRFNRRPRTPLPSGRFREKLVDFFRDDVELLAELTGRDLRAWHH